MALIIYFNAYNLLSFFLLIFQTFPKPPFPMGLISMKWVISKTNKKTLKLSFILLLILGQLILFSRNIKTYSHNLYQLNIIFKAIFIFILLIIFRSIINSRSIWIIRRIKFKFACCWRIKRLLVFTLHYFIF